MVCDERISATLWKAMAILEPQCISLSTLGSRAKQSPLCLSKWWPCQFGSQRGHMLVTLSWEPQTQGMNNVVHSGQRNRVENWETYHLTDHRVLDLVDASCKHPKRHGSVEEEVEEHVPSFPADSDYAAETHTHTHIRWRDSCAMSNT